MNPYILSLMSLGFAFVAYALGKKLLSITSLEADLTRYETNVQSRTWFQKWFLGWIIPWQRSMTRTWIKQTSDKTVTMFHRFFGYFCYAVAVFAAVCAVLFPLLFQNI